MWYAMDEGMDEIEEKPPEDEVHRDVIRPKHAAVPSDCWAMLGDNLGDVGPDTNWGMLHVPGQIRFLHAHPHRRQRPLVAQVASDEGGASGGRLLGSRPEFGRAQMVPLLPF